MKYSGMYFEEAMGYGWADAIHPEEKERVLEEWQLAISSGTEFRSELRFLDKNRKATWLEAKAVALYDTNRKLYGYIGMAIDIRERKKAEQTIKKEVTLSDSVINSLPGIFYMADQTPKLLRWNRELEIYTGYSAEELENMLPGNIIHPEDHPAFRNAIDKTYKEGTAEIEVNLYSKKNPVLFYWCKNYL
jgi:PAS domain S-box-containing protein